jgi:hypothetical protein
VKKGLATLLRRPVAFLLLAGSGVASSPLSAAAEDLTFDGEIYGRAFSAQRDGAYLYEFVRGAESTAGWTQLVSVQVHPRASRIADVMNAYAAARQPLYLRDVAVYRQQAGAHAEDVIFEFLLLAPDRSHVEIDLVRAVSDPGEPVVLYVFSKRIPSDAEGGKAGLRAASEKRSAWLRELGRLSLRPEPGAVGDGH